MSRSLSLALLFVGTSLLDTTVAARTAKIDLRKHTLPEVKLSLLARCANRAEHSLIWIESDSEVGNKISLKKYYHVFIQKKL